MTNPALTRAGGSGSGALVDSGVDRLRRYLNSAGAAETFAKWANEPMTAYMRAALQSLAATGPVHLDVNETAVQYGITIGLSLAAQLVTDPSAVYPELFTGVSAETVSVHLPDPDYGTAIEDVLDNKELT